VTSPRRAVSYVGGVLSACRPRYAIAFRFAHWVPLFTAGTAIAQLYRSAGFAVGEESAFQGPLRVLGGGPFYENLTIGRKVLIANDVVITVDGHVVIGDGASIGPFVRIYTGTHAIGPGSRRMVTAPIGKPVTIGRGAWIGVGVLVLPGVTIGDGCIIGAGSVVTSDIEPHTYAGGNPAQVIRSLPWKNR
jgi:acetyltransferase-like isoleucine patch superfamily enzyme